MTSIIKVTRVSEQGAEPVTLTEAKTQCRVTFSDDDTELTAMITRARKFIENYCNISIVLQTIRVLADACGCWELPYGPIVGITSVESPSLNQGSGPKAYTTSTEDWWVDGGLFDAGTYSDARTRVTYTAGNYCPDDLKAAILAQVAWLYEHRGEEEGMGSDEALELAAPFRKLWL
jgi:hypothetical protein